MKRLNLVLATALTLSFGSLNTFAHGYCGHGGGCGWWPFWSFGIGLGVGTAIGYSAAPRYPVYAYPYAYPVQAYTYAPATAVHTAPASSSYAQPTGNPHGTPRAPQMAVWVPHTPGAGKWVPDPNPYSYTPSEAAVASNTGIPRTEPAANAAVTPHER